MLYGIKEGDHSLIVAAADDAVELDTFYGNLAATGAPGLVSAEVASMVAVLTEARFKGYRKAPYLLVFADGERRDLFAATTGVELCLPNNLRDRQRHMLDANKPDRYATRDPSESDKTLAQIHGLTENDVWDRRTEDQKQFDAKMKKMADDLRKKGQLTASSFGPPPEEKTTTVTNDETGVETTSDPKDTTTEDSKVHVRSVDIRGNLASGIRVDVRAIKTEADAPEDDLPDDERLDVAPDGNIAVYHKAAVTGAKLVDIEPHLMATNLSKPATVKRNNATGCWLAYPVQRLAEQAAKALTEAGHAVEVYAVNDRGERLLPTGIKVVEEETGIGLPRPWNDQADAWDAQDEEARKEALKGIKGAEFIFCGYADGHGCIIYITPRENFTKTKDIWRGTSLPIGHLLPRDVVEIEPGLYGCVTRSFHLVNYEMHRRGFKESLRLQMHVNTLR